MIQVHNATGFSVYSQRCEGLAEHFCPGGCSAGDTDSCSTFKWEVLGLAVTCVFMNVGPGMCVCVCVAVEAVHLRQSIPVWGCP